MSAKTINRIFLICSLLNILAVILSLNLLYTWVFGDYVNGFQFVLWIVYINIYQPINLMLFPTVLIWLLSCLGWYLIFKSQPANTLKFQWLCMLLIIIATALEYAAHLELPETALSGLLALGAISAAGYLAVNAITTLKALLGKSAVNSPLSPILWGGCAMGLTIFLGGINLHAYGGLTRILIGFQIFIMAWLSMWLCEFFRANFLIPERFAMPDLAATD